MLCHASFTVYCGPVVLAAMHHNKYYRMMMIVSVCTSVDAMGLCVSLWTGKLSWDVTNHPGELSFLLSVEQ